MRIISTFQAVALFLETPSVPSCTSFAGLPKHRFSSWLKMMTLV